ncbi:hypothetical protein Fmac_018467 [Flemingia macrophylla]|uniref:Uncharacterized protein n=1 Tax=Flemingia macrophylla TaxID=520843 RepID=A0ABD1M561_9FABA
MLEMSDPHAHLQRRPKVGTRFFWQSLQLHQRLLGHVHLLKSGPWQRPQEPNRVGFDFSGKVNDGGDCVLTEKVLLFFRKPDVLHILIFKASPCLEVSSFQDLYVVVECFKRIVANARDTDEVRDGNC